MFKKYDATDRALLKLLICLGVTYGTVIAVGGLALVLFILHMMGRIQ